MSSKVDIDFHDVKTINLVQTRGTDRSWFSIIVTSSEGKEFEITLWPVAGESLVIKLGED